MGGTKTGGKKALETIKKKSGEDYFRDLGHKGGSVSHPNTRYFTLHPEFAKECGRKGGSISRRKKKGE